MSIAVAMPLMAQDSSDIPVPVTKDEVRSLFLASQDFPYTIEQTNRELLDAVRTRGVNFVFSTEEEWSLTLLEASDELLDAIREALPADEREARLRDAHRKKLYYDFTSNYRRNDVYGRTTALQAGKEFLRLYGSDVEFRDIAAQMRRMVPQLERLVRTPIRTVRTQRKSN